MNKFKDQTKCLSIDAEKRKESFFLWCERNLTPNSVKEIPHSIVSFEKNAQQKGILFSSIYEIDEKKKLDEIKKGFFGNKRLLIYIISPQTRLLLKVVETYGTYLDFAHQEKYSSNCYESAKSFPRDSPLETLKEKPKVDVIITSKDEEVVPEETSVLNTINPYIISEIWNYSIKRSFQSWLISLAYPQKSIDIYVFSLDQIINHFFDLLERAFRKSSTLPQIIFDFSILLLQNSEFKKMNSANQHVYTTSLSIFEKFLNKTSTQIIHKKKIDDTIKAISRGYALNDVSTDKRLQLDKHESSVFKLVNSSVIAEIWNDSIKRNFESWLIFLAYPQKSIDKYIYSLQHLMHYYSAQLEDIIKNSSSVAQSISSFSVLLLTNSNFRKTNIANQHIYTRTLSIFEKFCNRDDNPINYLSTEGIVLTKASYTDNSPTNTLTDFIQIDKQKKINIDQQLLKKTVSTENFLKDTLDTIKKDKRNNPSNLEGSLTIDAIWNDSIKKRFQTWLEQMSYSQGTTRAYIGSVDKVVSNFSKLLEEALNESLYFPQAVLKFSSLLKKNMRFINFNNIGHRQYSAAISAFERFWESVYTQENAVKNLKLLPSSILEKGNNNNSPVKVVHDESSHTEFWNLFNSKGTSKNVIKNLVTTQRSDLFVNFTKSLSYSTTIPISLNCFGVQFDDLNTWEQVYVQVMSRLYKDNPTRLQKYVGLSIIGVGKIDLGNTVLQSSMEIPEKISTDIYIETNLGATDIVKRIHLFMNQCDVDYKKVIIKYQIMQDSTDSSYVAISNESRPFHRGKAFADWLNSEGIAKITRNKFIYAIMISEQIATERKLPYCHLLEAKNIEEAKKTKEALFADKTFIDKNMSQNNLYCTAINKYIDYFLSISDIVFTKKEEIPSKDHHALPTQLDPLIVAIKARVIPYTDNRKNSGNLWIIGGLELRSFVSECRKMGVHFTFRENGGRSTAGKAAWWTQDTALSSEHVAALTPKAPTSKAPSPKTQAYKAPATLTNTTKNPQINQKRVNSYKKVLEKDFTQGFRTASKLEARRFRSSWKKIYGEALEADDGALETNIRSTGIFYKGFVYLPECMMNECTRIEMFEVIERWLTEGRSAIYYEALFDALSNELYGQCINSVGMLRAYISHVNHGRYLLDSNYLTSKSVVEIDAFDELRNLLMAFRAPMRMDVIYNKLEHIPPHKIKQMLYSNEFFLSSALGEYFYVGIIDITPEELDEISKTIDKEVAASKYITGNEMIDLLEQRHPSIMDRYEHISVLGKRKTIAYFLNKQFSFKGNIVSAKNHELTMKEVYANFCKNRGRFTISDLNALKNELNTTIYFDSVYANSLRVSNIEFVSKSIARFDVSLTDAVIDRFCQGDYTPIQEITSFSAFPNAGYPWNTFLLEHYVWEFSKKYRLLHTGFNAESVVGAIVKRTSPLTDYRELLADALANSKIELTQTIALEYLHQKGYIARKYLADSKQLLATAKYKRGERG